MARDVANQAIPTRSPIFTNSRPCVRLLMSSLLVARKQVLAPHLTAALRMKSNGGRIEMIYQEYSIDLTTVQQIIEQVQVIPRRIEEFLQEQTVWPHEEDNRDTLRNLSLDHLHVNVRAGCRIPDVNHNVGIFVVSCSFVERLIWNTKNEFLV